MRPTKSTRAFIALHRALDERRRPGRELLGREDELVGALRGRRGPFARPGRVSVSSPAAASAIPSTSSGSTSTPLTPSSTTSGTPPTRPPTTARPRQNASSTMRGVPSAREGRSKSQASSSARTISSAGSPASSDAIGKLRDERLRDITSVTVADQPQRCAGHPLGDEPPGGGKVLDVLVRLEHAHEERPRLGGQLGGRRLGERLEVGEGDERRRRLDADLARQAGRVRRRASAPRPRGEAPTGRRGRSPATAHDEAASRRAGGTCASRRGARR